MNQKPSDHPGDLSGSESDVPSRQEYLETASGSSLPPNPYGEIPQPENLIELKSNEELGFGEAYWILVGVCVLAVTVVSLVAPASGIPASFVLILSLFRVFMVRLKLRKRGLLKNAVGPIASLMASAPIVFGIFVASCLAFLAICFPLALITSVGYGSESISFLFSVSGLIAVAFFFWLYVLSFRLSI